VIAIIAILAALLLPAAGKIRQNAAKARARTELTQLEQAINNYKQKLGFYPPDNTNNYARNSLYFELLGAEFNGTRYRTLDGSATVNVSGGVIPPAVFGTPVTGIMNASRGTASDDGGGAVSFIRELKPAQYGHIVSNVTELVRVLGVKVDGPAAQMVGDINPFRYNSSNPTNNPNSFDLWVDIVVGGKTNRISNWSQQPQIVP
jgi:type II secretory pathway pseudopilin PulG